MATPDPTSSNSAPSADSSVELPTSHAAGGAAPSPADEAATLRAELLNERLAAAGIGAEYVDLVAPTFSGAPTREAVAAFAASLRQSKPALFGPAPGNTAPTPSRSVPSAPPPGGRSADPKERWSTLMEASRGGDADSISRRADAVAFWLTNQHAIR